MSRFDAFVVVAHDANLAKYLWYAWVRVRVRVRCRVRVSVRVRV